MGIVNEWQKRQITYLFKFLEDISPSCGITDVPVLGLLSMYPWMGIGGAQNWAQHRQMLYQLSYSRNTQV